MKALRLIALLCLLPLAFSSCRKSKIILTPHAPSVPNTLFAGTFIDKAGTYTHTDAKGGSKLDLSTGGTAINWTLEISRNLPGGASTGGCSQSGMSLDAATDPWFVYVETPLRIWIFDGTKELNYSLHDDGGSRAGPAIFDGKLQYSDHKVPDDVIRKLPTELQKLFPPLAPAGPRPSI